MTATPDKVSVHVRHSKTSFVQKPGLGKVKRTPFSTSGKLTKNSYQSKTNYMPKFEDENIKNYNTGFGAFEIFTGTLVMILFFSCIIKN